MEMMNIYLFKKVAFSIFEIFNIIRKTSSPYLMMTLLVKNEGDLLEENLRFHKAMGVDGFIITDNNSTDRTMDIIRKYQQKGWVKEVIIEKETNYEQKAWVDRMIWRAKTVYQADWVINADADELWYAPSGNLKDELSNTRVNTLNCELRSVYPEENKPFWRWKQAVKAVTNQEDYDLSLYSIFERQNPKVVHRTSGYVQISMGNHKVTMFPKLTKYSNIRVYHYNIRGRKHFLEKMINGGKQLEQRRNRHGGRHWRYFYRLYKEGLLDKEYDRVIGATQYERLNNEGFIFTDTTIPDLFKNIDESGRDSN